MHSQHNSLVLAHKGHKVSHVTIVANSLNCRKIEDKQEILLPVELNLEPKGTEYQNLNLVKGSGLVWVRVPRCEKRDSVSSQKPRFLGTNRIVKFQM